MVIILKNTGQKNSYKNSGVISREIQPPKFLPNTSQLFYVRAKTNAYKMESNLG